MMKRSIQLLALSVFVFGLLLLITSCGGGSATNNGGGNGGGTGSPSITTSSLPSGTVGAAYAANLQASGGKAPYTWTLKSGVLPTGLSLSSAGALSGTPSVAGTVGSLVFQVTDANNKSASSSNLSVKIDAEIPPQVTTSSLPNAVEGIAYSVNLQATGGKAPYTWTISAGTLPAGLTLNASGLISGTPGASGNFSNLVFAATDIYNGVGNSNQLNLHVDAAALVTTSSLPSGQVGANYAFNLQATGGSGSYTWSVKSGTLPGGLSLNAATGAITGKPTAPGIVTPIVFQVVDADTSTAVSGNLSLQVYDALGCSAGSENKMGTQPYAFLVKGFDSNGPVTMIGAFTPDGAGNITGGAEDVNRVSGGQTGLSITSAGSSYTLGPDNNGCLTLTNSASATTTFRFSLGGVNGGGAFTNGHLIEFDDNNGAGTRGTGVLRLQDSSSFSGGLSGMYAFLFTGQDSAGGPFAVTGSMQTAGGNVTSLALDYDDFGSLGTNITGGTGTYSAADGNGRGTTSLAATGYTLNAVYYMVSAHDALFASTDAIAVTPMSSGEALSTGGPFSLATLNNNYVAHATGLSVNGPVPAITTGSFDGNGTITSGYLTQNRGGVVSSWVVNGTYSVDATTGRVAFTGNFITPIGYLVTNFPGVGAFLVGSDFPATAGMLEPQTSAQPPAGVYTFATDTAADSLSSTRVGTVTLAGSNFSGTTNMSNPASPFLVLNQPIPSTGFSFVNGAGTFGANTDAVTSGSSIYYLDETLGAHPSVTEVTK